MALFQLSNRLDVKKQDSKVSTSFGENADSFFGLVPKRWQIPDYVCSTGKSLSEAFILTSTNPQYDKRLFIELPVQDMKTTSSEHVVHINWSEYQNKNQFVYKTCHIVG